MGCFFMVIVTRKKITQTIGIITMFMLFFAICTYSFKGQKKEQVQEIQTVALPVNNKVIVLDAGHGIPDERSSE